ncbi:MAG TPA: hypothetical protein VD913_00435 [bacterium]|nr:hypothetical protein [bacterium]
MNIRKKININRFDLFAVLGFLLAGTAVYATWIHPVSFSNRIVREGIMRYVETEILLPGNPADLPAMPPAGYERKNVYGEDLWKILRFEETAEEGETFYKVHARILVEEKDGKQMYYGKYLLKEGRHIYLSGDGFAFNGRILRFQLLPERVLI